MLNGTQEDIQGDMRENKWKGMQENILNDIQDDIRENDGIVYFELNNWFSGRDYPDAEPFFTWMNDNNYGKYFMNDNWCKENKICVIVTFVDMSNEFLITAPKLWVKQNCPELLDKYSRFLRYPDEDADPDDIPEGKIAEITFMEYAEENFGCHWYEEVEDSEGYVYYIEADDNSENLC